MNKIIKKLFLSLLSLLILISFNACKNIENEESDRTSTNIVAENEAITIKPDDVSSSSKSDKDNNATNESTNEVMTDVSKITVVNSTEDIVNNKSTNKVATENSTKEDASKTASVDIEENISEPNSSVAVYKMNCIINEIKENHFIVEKTNNGKKSGILYQFNYSSEHFNVGDEIVVEYKYPIAESFPYGLTNVISIYKIDY